MDDPMVNGSEKSGCCQGLWMRRRRRRSEWNAPKKEKRRKKRHLNAAGTMNKSTNSSRFLFNRYG